MSLVFAVVFLTIVLPIAAQAPAADEQKVRALISEVQAQAAQIADNQTKIDSKLVEITETLRTARIFAGRGGK